MNDILLIGEVVDVVGISTKVEVYEEKNTSRLLYNGKVIKNIAVGNYVKILKGYTEIIAVIEGEYIKEAKNVSSYSKHSDTYSRVLDIKILGHFTDNKAFVKGVYETPMISNYVYVLQEDEVQKIFCFTKDTEPVIRIGNISGYDNYKLAFSIQKLFASHIGIFGNTGSGKSNTLAKVYTELFRSGLNYRKSNFILIDFNDEYISDTVLTSEKKVYRLDTRTNEGDKFPLPRSVIEDSLFWSIILDATDKTQRPFLERVLKSLRYYKNHSISFTDLIRVIHENSSKFNKVKTDTAILLHKIYGGNPSDYERLFDDIEYHSVGSCLYNRSSGLYFNVIDSFKDYFITKIQEFNCGNIFNPVDCQTLDPLNLFDIVLRYKHIYEMLKGYSNDEHISPMMKRSEKRISEISKVLEFKDPVQEDDEKNIQIVSISNCNIHMKKIIPLLICKEVYDKQKEAQKGSKSLHLIIDEAHNILSENSNRESASWKDYRLEVFEEIIKEGRKFGCFMTISSQRPSDISATLVSQLHNYFIHRLVNDEDLFTIRKSVAFLDRSKQEMIPILSQGQCICSGLALDFPVNVQVDELDDINKPDSKDINIVDLWKVQ
ncbi:ATP-binding protein [Desulfosporosinus nitroreducens]|uniref:ATP-binding protein n=1 Tax=Desulfosporosinus nitroreducens TaxID=2018668 RepID=UPI00207C17CF|nr:ATP-binding protein [Desulfosporosinus nitroreducens]MCO1600020.1 ATP-binding protein [Desulfosporosinus nitroreducens]